MFIYIFADLPMYVRGPLIRRGGESCYCVSVARQNESEDPKILVGGEGGFNIYNLDGTGGERVAVSAGAIWGIQWHENEIFALCKTRNKKRSEILVFFKRDSQWAKIRGWEVPHTEYWTNIAVGSSAFDPFTVLYVPTTNPQIGVKAYSLNGVNADHIRPTPLVLCPPNLNPCFVTCSGAPPTVFVSDPDKGEVVRFDEGRNLSVTFPDSSPRSLCWDSGMVFVWLNS